MRASIISSYEWGLWHAVLKLLIIRDHDNYAFQNRKNHLVSIAEQINAKWGAGTVELCITDQYYNMKEIIEQNIHLIENAKKACEKSWTYS